MKGEVKIYIFKKSTKQQLIISGNLPSGRFN